MIHSARTEDEKSVLMDSYTDKLLIFDFDPQDSFFRNHRDEACRRFQKLMEFFSESTDHGKLYLSYPMIEAFLHVRAAEISHGCFNAFLNDSFLWENCVRAGINSVSAMKVNLPLQAIIGSQ